MLKTLINAGLFQLGWLACVLGGNSPWLLVAAAALLIHLLWISPERTEVRLVAYVCLLGTAVDTLLLNLGAFAFEPATRLIPFWLILLWALLATTLRHCLAWTAQPKWRAVLLGAIGGPLSYYAGQRLGAVAFPLGLWPTLLGLGLLWAGLFPGLLWIAAHSQSK